MRIVIIVIICIYLAFNIVTAKMMSDLEMKNHFVDGQCVVGKVAANVFYFPAWLLKGIKFLINILVK